MKSKKKRGKVAPQEDILKPYQERFQDGFITNKLLEKPYIGRGFKEKRADLYSALDRETIMIGGACFLPTWDSTDHLHFVCRDCKTVADVLIVTFDSNYGKGTKGYPKYALFFYLGCPECGNTGQRKVYLDMHDDACQFQNAFDGKIYLYGKEREPYKVIDPHEVIKNYLSENLVELELLINEARNHAEDNSIIDSILSKALKKVQETQGKGGHKPLEF